MGCELCGAEESLKRTADYQGKLTNAASIKECFELEDEISYHAERLYVYAHMHHDEDTANPTYQALSAKAKN